MNARQIEGWAIHREVTTRLKNHCFAFFTDREIAEKEAARFSKLLDPYRVVPAVLIIPPEQS